MKDRSPTLQRKNETSSSPALQDIDGYSDIGLEKDARKLIYATLRKDTLSAEKFHELIFILLSCSHRYSKTAPLVEQAWARLPKPEKRKARATILIFHASHGEYAKAEPFVSGRPTTVLDLLYSFDTLVAMERLKEADRLQMRLASVQCEEPYLRNQIRLSLANYHCRIGNWENARMIFALIEPETGALMQKVKGLVQAHLHLAMSEVQGALAALPDLSKRHDELAVAQPGLEKGLLDETERFCRKWERRVQGFLDRQG